MRWQRRLEGAIVPGPVTLGEIAYVASNGGVLHALDIRSGKDRWTFDGGGSYGSDLSTAPALLRNGLILWPGPRQRVFALTPQGKLRWTLSLAADPLTPIIDSARHLLAIADTAGGLSAYRLTPGDAALIHYTYSSPLTLAGHRVVFGNHSGDVSILDTHDGHLIIRAHGGGQLWTAAAVDARGDLYFASRTGGIYAFAADGRTLLIGDDAGLLRAIR